MYQMLFKTNKIIAGHSKINIILNMLQRIIMKVCMKEKSISIATVVINLAAQKPPVMLKLQQFMIKRNHLTAKSVLKQSQETFEDATLH